LGDWVAPADPLPVKDFSVALPQQTPRILLVNRPNSPQSIVIAAQVLPILGREDQVVLRAANEVLGASFLSRINMDLRETKGWSYGSRSVIGDQDGRALFRIIAPVQADKTGDTVRAVQADVALFLGANGVNQEERDRTVNGNILGLPGGFETAEAVLGGIQSIVEQNRQDNYYETLAARYRGMTAAQMDAAIRAQVDPAKFVYVIVGDATTVRPQLEGLGLPIETVDPATLGGQ
jgi:zinc protease